MPAGGWLLVLWFAEHEGLADAVALPSEFHEPSVVDDAVDDRGGEFVVREDRAPFAELDVRGGYLVVKMMLLLSYELVMIR